MNDTFEILFISLQSMVVAFLLLHDWLPLGSLNNLSAMQREDSLQRRIFMTLLPAVPAGVGLYASLQSFGHSHPMWLQYLLWINYGILVLGILRAWWIPYLFGSDKQRAERYQVIFAGTHRFLPARNGMAPDTLHTLFHLVAFATLALILVRDRI